MRHMPATLGVREESDETAELQDLLSRLQTYHVYGEFGLTMDEIKEGPRKMVNELKELFPNRAKVLKKCGYLLETLKDKNAHAGDIEVPLREFIEQMKIIQNKDENTDNKNMTELANKWQSLRIALITYRYESSTYTPDSHRPMTKDKNGVYQMEPRIDLKASAPVNEARYVLMFVMRSYIARFGKKVIEIFYHQTLSKRYFEHWDVND
jgi:hypothetical protein